MPNRFLNKFALYIQLIEETGRTIREDKPGFIPEQLAPILSRLNLAPRGWMNMTQLLQANFSYAIGTLIILSTS
jgi:hypothetical protein